MKDKLYHMGIRGKVSRSTIAYANENRNWRIYIVLPTGFYLRKYYPEKLRRAVSVNINKNIRLNLFTNQMTLPALTIAQLYQCHLQVELLFKWIKQHLPIKAFYGTSENAVKIQIWIAISKYV